MIEPPILPVRATDDEIDTFMSQVWGWTQRHQIEDYTLPVVETLFRELFRHIASIEVVLNPKQ